MAYIKALIACHLPEMAVDISSKIGDHIILPIIYSSLVRKNIRFSLQKKKEHQFCKLNYCLNIL